MQAELLVLGNNVIGLEEQPALGVEVREKPLVQFLNDDMGSGLNAVKGKRVESGLCGRPVTLAEFEKINRDRVDVASGGLNDFVALRVF